MNKKFYHYINFTWINYRIIYVNNFKKKFYEIKS